MQEHNNIINLEHERVKTLTIEELNLLYKQWHLEHQYLEAAETNYNAEAAWKALGKKHFYLNEIHRRGFETPNVKSIGDYTKE